jgi:hypothetical protein
MLFFLERVTDIRQDLANNGRLAYLFVSRELHIKILHQSPYLFEQITGYVKDETIFPKTNQSTKDNLNNVTSLFMKKWRFFVL